MTNPLQVGQRTKTTLILTLISVLLPLIFPDLPPEVMTKVTEALLALSAYFFAAKVQRSVEIQEKTQEK